MIPAESSSVAAAIRSSIFCWRLPEILVGAGVRRCMATDAGPSAGGAPARRCGLPAPSSEVFINDFGPPAAIVFERTILAAF